MRALLALSILALLPPLLVAPAAARERRSIRLVRIAAPSLGDPARSVRVYLPPSYGRPESREQRYPVVYLLHGWPGSDDNWPDQGRCGPTLDSLAASGEIPEVIGIMPNGHGMGLLGRSLWLNNVDGRSRLEDFLAGDLVTWVDSTYRTLADPGHRAVIGLSDGGTAAFNLVMRHRDRFSAAGSLSGRFHLRHELGLDKAVIGTGEEAERFLAENSPSARLEAEKASLVGARLYVDCGVDDPEIEENRIFHEELTRAGVPHEYHEYAGGHGWPYWRTHLRDALLGVIGTRALERTASP